MPGYEPQYPQQRKPQPQPQPQPQYSDDDVDYSDLSKHEQQHADTFTTIIDGLQKFEREALAEIKHDYDQVKTWLNKHPKVKAAGIVFGGKTALYLVKRYRMGSPRAAR